MVDRPLIIIGAPRSGTTILRNCLAQHRELWHLRAESHEILEGPLHPEPTFDSNRCTASAITREECNTLCRTFYRRALNLNVLFHDPSLFFKGDRLLERIALHVSVPVLGVVTQLFKGNSIRLLEKTPKNSLRVALLARLFPDAYFVWNKRKPEDNIDSLVAGWRAMDGFGPFKRPRFATYDVADELNLQDYDGTAWKFALVPEWRSLGRKRIADVAAWQYFQCNRYALRDFQSVDDDQMFEVKHEAFVQKPLKIVKEIVDWADLSQSRSVDRFADSLPRVNDTRNGDRNKKSGLRYPKEVRRALAALPELLEVIERMGYCSQSSTEGT